VCVCVCVRERERERERVSERERERERKKERDRERDRQTESYSTKCTKRPLSSAPLSQLQYCTQKRKHLPCRSTAGHVTSGGIKLFAEKRIAFLKA